MSRDTITRQRELSENARAALQPFVAAWRALDSGLTDAQRALYAERIALPKTEPTTWKRAVERRRIALILKSPAVELCDAMDAMNDAANDALLAYPDSGVTWEQELNA